MIQRHPTRSAKLLCLALLCLALPDFALGQAKKQTQQPPKTTVEPVAPSTTPPVDPRELVRRVAEREFENEKIARSYTYVQREETRKLDGDGKVKSTESETSEIMVLYDEPVERLIAKNDQPLSSKDAAKVEEKIDKFMRDRKNETPEQKRERLTNEERDREKARAYIAEVADAYNFHLDGIENLNGRDTYIVSAEPRPDYHAKTRVAGALLPNFRFRIWIDKADGQWVMIDAEAINNASYGLFLLRLHKGTRAHLEQTRVNDEVWLPVKIYVKLDARVVLFKSYDEEIDISYKDYKKFRTEVKMGPAVSTQ